MIKMSKMHKRLCAKSAAMLALSAAWPMATAYADEVAAAPAAMTDAAPAAATDATPAAGQLETVTVTAQRRKENIREVPSLNVESSNGRTFPRFYIRGYGNTDFNIFASQPVSLIYDDVVQENPILKGYPIFDVAGVEVLRGPQGTLFGRNTPAGVVKFESVKPNLDKVEGYYNVSTATHNTSNFDGAVNVPLSKEWALRFSTLRQHRDDYVDNTFTGQKNALDGYNEHAERVQLLYAPNTTFNALFNVHQRNTTGSARVFYANLIKQGTNDIVDGFDPNKSFTNARNFQRLRTNGASARLSWDLDGVKLYSITGFEQVGNYVSHGDIDGGAPNRFGPTSPNFIPFQVETADGITSVKQYSQEFRAESKNAGPLNWQAGV